MTCTDQTEPMHTGPVQRLKLTNVMASSQLWATAACLITPNLKAKQTPNGSVAKMYICWGCKLDIYLTEALKAPDQPLCLCDWDLSLLIESLLEPASIVHQGYCRVSTVLPWLSLSALEAVACITGNFVFQDDGVVVTEVLNLAFSWLPSRCSSTDNQICETNDNSFWYFCLKTRFASHHKGCLYSIGIFSFK